MVSLREYRTLGPLWRMVRRTAFTELRHSYALLALLALLALAVLGLALLFVLPPALVPLGIAAAAVALPSGRFFGLAPGWALAFPLAGALYGGMTLDSGRRYLLRRRRTW